MSSVKSTSPPPCPFTAWPARFPLGLRRALLTRTRHNANLISFVWVRGVTLHMARFNPPLPTVSGTCVRLIMQCLTQAQISLTKFDYIDISNPGNPSLSELQAFRAAWRTLVEGSILLCLTPLTSITGYFVQELFYGTTPSDQFNLPSPVPGTQGTNNLPLIMAAVTRSQTAVKGQRGRGRTAWPAVPDSFTTPATDPDILNATGIAKYTSVLGSLATNVVVGTRTWNWSILTPPAPPATLIRNGSAIVSSTVDSILGSMRRRKIGRGI